MLYVFTGTDTVAVRRAAHELLDAFVERGARPERLAADACSADALRDYAGAQSLFASGDDVPTVVILDTPSEKTGALDTVVSLAELLAQSASIFVLIEGKLLAAHAKPLKNVAEKYTEVASAAPTQAFNAFALSDALAQRDKKTLWVLLARAKNAGLSAEEIIGTLFWQLKMMRMAAQTRSAEEADMKPFVYTKAKRGAAHFKDGELAALSEKIVVLYHDARLGKGDIDRVLEQWVLGM